MYAAPLVAEQLGIPWASIILSPSAFLSAHDPSALPPLPPAVSALLRRAGLPVNRALLQLVLRSTRSWGAPVAALRAELGLQATVHPIFTDIFSPWLTLAMFSPHFAQPQPDWPVPTEITGFAFFDGSFEPQDNSLENLRVPGLAPELPPELTAFLNSGEPPIVFTLGSAAVINAGNFYPQSAAIARQLGRRALLLVGPNRLPDPHDANQLAVPYAPYSAIFPRACAAVHQGGIGTTAQAMRAGIPQLILPHGFDQPDNAARVARLGLGAAMPRKAYTPARAVPVLRRLLQDEAIRRCTQTMARQLAGETGLGNAADAVERLLRQPAQAPGIPA